MAKRTRRTKRNKKTARITFRTTPQKKREITERARSRRLTCSGYLAAAGSGDGIALGWVADEELRQAVNTAEALKESNLGLLELALDLPDPEVRQRLMDYTLHSLMATQAYRQLLGQMAESWLKTSRGGNRNAH